MVQSLGERRLAVMRQQQALHRAGHRHIQQAGLIGGIVALMGQVTLKIYADYVYSTMKLVFFETPLFTRLLPHYLDDEAYQSLQKALLENPGSGDIIPGTGGFRKMRWEDRRRGKGKQGGLRIVYYFLAEDHQIWFFTMYDKDEAVDLTPEERRVLKKAIQTELDTRRQR